MKKNLTCLLVLFAILGSISLVVSNFNFGVVSSVDAKSSSKGGLVFDLTSSTSTPETIYGYVSDVKTRHPLAGAKVDLKVGTTTKDSTSTGEDGSYSFGITDTGTYKIAVSILKYQSVQLGGLKIIQNDIDTKAKFVANFSLKHK